MFQTVKNLSFRRFAVIFNLPDGEKRLIQRSVVAGGAFDDTIHHNVHDNDKRVENRHSLRGSEHGAGVIKSMQENGCEIPQNQINPFSRFVSSVFAQLRLAVKNAHENGESEVSGNGCQSPRKGDGDSVGKDIFDIFKHCKSQGNKCGINNAVKQMGKIPVPPCAPL